MKKKLLLSVIILICTAQVFSQDTKAESSDKAKKSRSFELTVDAGMSLVQDKFSPSLSAKAGFTSKNFKIHLVGSSNYYYSTIEDNLRIQNIETYYGFEFVDKSFFDQDRFSDKYVTDNWWYGIGLSYCPKPFIELHKKEVYKIYWIMDFGTIGIDAGYVYSDFLYPSVSVNFGF